MFRAISVLFAKLASLLFVLYPQNSWEQLPPPTAKSVYEFEMDDIKGSKVKLSQFQGKVVLIVNVASKCGFTRQYSELEKLYKEYKDKGLVVLGFPANDFGGQEPGSDKEIHEFCTTKFNVTFPMFSKISVAGKDAAPLYQYLTYTLKESVKWNFNKFLVDKTGKPVKHFGSSAKVSDPEFINALKSYL